MKKWDISVLYVEDERILRDIYQRILSNRVKKFILAEDGEQGYKKYLQHNPDLIITDIKMPVMSGLDLARKIRMHDPGARVAIMSAYGESHHFIRAIETGVKGFLLKPVDNEKLYQLIDEQAREVLLEATIKEEEEKRRKAEEALRGNEAILQAVSDVAEDLFRHPLNQATINRMLKRLGTATRVSRAYYFQNHESEGVLYSSQTHEWVNEGVEPQIDNEELTNTPMTDDSPFARWKLEMGKHNPIFGLVRDFPPLEQAVLVPQHIISILVVPIFIEKNWHGFIGFDECHTERVWSKVEANTLLTAASIFGAAIQRSRIENELRNLNLKLEERVKERTKNLQKEIAEKRQAEELLRDSEEKYRLIFENANDGIFLSLDGQIEFINPKAYEITGYLPKMVMGKPFTQFIHPDYREMVLDNHHRRLKGEEVAEKYDIVIIDAQQKYKWVELKSNLIKWDDTYAVLTFMTDIDVRKQYENELELLNLKLEERVKQERLKIEKQQRLLVQKSKLESLGELAAGMAHEINQPMGGLSLSLDNILYEMGENNLSEDYLKNKINLMFTDIERIRELINHVRVFSRDQEKKQRALFSINKVINNALMMVNKMFIDHQVDLEVSLSTQNIMVMGNEFQLEQVLLNILTNSKHAVDQKAKKGEAKDYNKKIALYSTLMGSELQISLRDNGIGIPDAHIDRIFDPFFTTKQAEEGTGLGLSISYGIIKEMGGSIEVESQVDAFTEIKIILPVNENGI